jgi:hypothetical protein
MQEEVYRQSAVNHGGDHIRWGWVAVTAFVLEVAIVLSAFGWVAIYSYLIHRGEQAAYYENYAQFASPIVSIVLGVPYWFFACRWVGRKGGTRAVAMGLWVWFILFIIDMALYLLGEPTTYYWVMAAISEPTKLLAAYLGGRAALRVVPRSGQVVER